MNDTVQPIEPVGMSSTGTVQ